MKKAALLTISGLLLSANWIAPNRAYGATAEEAQALVERAVAHVKKVGEEQAFKDFTNKEGGFLEGELYVFCYSPDVTLVAIGGNPGMIGKNLRNLKDPDGKEASYELVQMGLEHGSGWVDYKWPNPVTKKIQTKSAYVIKVNDKVCGTGYYK
jgi:signal transduction histidine kinase